jgi:hypothetical protein
MALTRDSILGVDSKDALWVIRRDGSQAGRWDGKTWTYYGLQQGWARPALASPLTFAYQPVEANGAVWVATDRDLRRFNGQTWQVFSIYNMGFSDLSLRLKRTYVVGPESDGNILVGSCVWKTVVSPPLGQGELKRWDGVKWRDAGLPVSGCITAIARDAGGNPWVGVDGSLWRYDSSAHTWSSFAPPSLPGGGQYGYVREILNAPDGSIWPLWSMCTEAASCAGTSLRYRLVDGNWHPVGGVESLQPARIFFDAAGQSWSLDEKALVLLVNGQPVQTEALPPLGAAATKDGRVWMVAVFQDHPALWVRPPQQ